MADVAESSADTSALGDIEILDEAGETVAVSSLWRARPAVLVFVRHFG